MINKRKAFMFRIIFILIITIIFILNCGEDFFNEKLQFKYSNTIGAINLTKDYKEYEVLTTRWNEDCSYIIYLTRITKDVDFYKYIVNKLDLVNREKYSFNIKYFWEIFGPPIISPDGRWLVYTGATTNNCDIYRVDASNPEGEPERLTYKGYSNDNGSYVKSGVYLLKIESEGCISSLKMVVDR
jgi:hypothetical protein